MQKHSAIWINAKEKKIELIEIETLKDMQTAVEGYIEDAGTISKHEGITTHLYVNEEGRFIKFPYGFLFYDMLIIGNGLIIGMDREGETASVSIPMEVIKSAVTFKDLSDVSIMNIAPRFVIIGEDDEK
jgi:hypothetical protein